MKISVVIPLYNKRETILRALNSVLNQTFLPEEIIVVNDGSKDGSESVVAKIKHPLLKLVNQPNLGVSAARNKGILESRSEWVAFLDADDEWDKDYLSELQNLSLSYPGYVVYGALVVNNRFVKCTAENILLFRTPLDYARQLYKQGPVISIISSIIKREELIKVDLFPVGVKAGEDLLTLFKLTFIGSFCISCKKLVRIEAPAPGQRQIRTSLLNDPLLDNLNLFLENRKKREKKAVRLFKAFWYKARSSTYLINGLRKHSINYAIKGIKIVPFNLKLITYLLLNILPFSSGQLLFKRILEHRHAKNDY